MAGDGGEDDALALCVLYMWVFKCECMYKCTCVNIWKAFDGDVCVRVCTRLQYCGQQTKPAGV